MDLRVLLFFERRILLSSLEPFSSFRGSSGPVKLLPLVHQGKALASGMRSLFEKGAVVLAPSSPGLFSCVLVSTWSVVVSFFFSAVGFSIQVLYFGLITSHRFFLG